MNLTNYFLLIFQIFTVYYFFFQKCHICFCVNQIKQSIAAVLYHLNHGLELQSFKSTEELLSVLLFSLLRYNFVISIYCDLIFFTGDFVVILFCVSVYNYVIIHLKSIFKITLLNCCELFDFTFWSIFMPFFLRILKAVCKHNNLHKFWGNFLL